MSNLHRAITILVSFSVAFAVIFLAKAQSPLLTCQTESTIDLTWLCTIGECQIISHLASNNSAVVVNFTEDRLYIFNISGDLIKEESLLFPSGYEQDSNVDFVPLGDNEIVFYKQDAAISYYRYTLSNNTFTPLTISGQTSFPSFHDAAFSKSNISYLGSSSYILLFSIRDKNYEVNQARYQILAYNTQSNEILVILDIVGPIGGYRPWRYVLGGKDGKVYMQLWNLDSDFVIIRRKSLGGFAWETLNIPYSELIDGEDGLRVELDMIDSWGNMYFSSSGQITKISPTGNRIWQASFPQGNLVNILDITDSGTLIFSSNQSIQRCIVELPFTPTPTATPITAPPPGGGDPLCPGGGGEWMWVDGELVFVCGVTWE